MRLVHYMPRIVASEGGTPRAVMDMCALLAVLGNDVTLLVQTGADIPSEWRTGAEGLPSVVETGPGGRRGARFDAKQLATIDRTIRGADAVHLHAVWQPEHVQVAKIAKAHDVPVVLTPHGHLDDWPMSQSRLKKRVFLATFGRAMLRRLDGVHCTAEGEARQSRKWLRGVPATVIPLPFDVRPFETLPGIEPATKAFDLPAPPTPVVLFLSRLHEKKRPDIAVRAFAAAGPEAGVLVVAGPGDEDAVRSLERLARELGVEGRVRIVGQVSGVTKVSLYERADVLLLPTSQENFGLVIPEAMACQTPVVTTRGVDMWPTIESEAGAMIVDQTPEAFAAALKGLLASEPNRRALGERGRAWVLESLDARRTVADLETFYRRLGRRPMETAEGIG